MKMNVAYDADYEPHTCSNLRVPTRMTERLSAYPFEFSKGSLGMLSFVEFLEASHLWSSHTDSFQVLLLDVLKHTHTLSIDTDRNFITSGLDVNREQTKGWAYTGGTDNNCKWAWCLNLDRSAATASTAKYELNF